MANRQIYMKCPRIWLFEFLLCYLWYDNYIRPRLNISYWLGLNDYKFSYLCVKHGQWCNIYGLLNKWTTADICRGPFRTKMTLACNYMFFVCSTCHLFIFAGDFYASILTIGLFHFWDLSRFKSWCEHMDMAVIWKDST